MTAEETTPFLTLSNTSGSVERALDVAQVADFGRAALCILADPDASWTIDTLQALGDEAIRVLGLDLAMFLDANDPLIGTDDEAPSEAELNERLIATWTGRADAERAQAQAEINGTAEIETADERDEPK